MLGPAALAEPLEAHVWQRVGEGLLDPALVAEGLTAAREQNEAAVARGERLNTLDREIGRLRVRLERIVAERLDADTGSEAARALKALGDEAEATIARLLAERAELAAQPSPGLSDAAAAALETFAAGLREGLKDVEQADRGDRRRIYDLLRLQVRLRRDDSEAGIKFARKNRFGIALRSFELADNDREHKKTRMRFYTDEYAAWEAKHMPQVEAVTAT
jgi:hypothetical protein